MIKLWIAFGLTLMGVLVWLFRPFWQKSTVPLTASQAPSHRQLNTEIYRDEFARLDEDLAQGLIDSATHAQTQAELRLRLLAESSQDEAATNTQGSPRRIILLLSALVPALSMGLYLFLGQADEVIQAASAPAPVTQQDIENMVDGLAQKLEKDPSNLKDWTMLARSYAVMRRPIDAEKAFDRAGSYVDNDAQLLAEYADVAAINAQGQFQGKPLKLIAQALKVDPNNAMALWLAGTAAYRNQDHKEAVQFWEHLLKQLPSNSDDARMIQSSIDEVRSKAHLQPSPSAASASVSATSVSGVVELDAQLKAKAQPNDTLMVIARPKGQRMPVAIVRAKVTDLPLAFNLNDASSMSPEARISTLSEVSVQARISKSGMAQPESGDLISTAQIVALGAKNVKIKVDQIRP